MKKFVGVLLLLVASVASAQTSNNKTYRFVPSSTLTPNCGEGQVCLWDPTTGNYSGNIVLDNNAIDYAVPACQPSNTGDVCSWDATAKAWTAVAALNPSVGGYVAYCAGVQNGGPGGTQMSAGEFYAPATALGAAFYEALVKPVVGANGGYVYTDGSGGAHSMLFGVTSTGNRPGLDLVLTGNINNNSGSPQPINSFDGMCYSEWSHMAVYTDGSSQTWTYVKGVPSGKVAFSGTRQSPAGLSAGSGPLYLCGSDHSMWQGYLVYARAYETNVPLLVSTAPQNAFYPDTLPQGDSANGADNGFVRPVALWDFTVPGAHIIPDLGTGWNGGAGTSFLHPLTFNSSAPPYGGVIYGSIQRNVTSKPTPTYVYDSTAPISLNGANAAQTVCIDTPTTPPVGSYVFDSFSRIDQTWFDTAAPSLGSTEGGSQGVLAWNPVITLNDSGAWGILNNRAVKLVNGVVQSWAWVDSGHASYTIKTKRNVSSFADEDACNAGASVAGDCSNTGIVWRVDTSFSAGAGTVSTTSGSRTVTGVGTSFSNSNIGQQITIGGVVYTISTVATTTSITLRTTASATNTGVAYTLSNAQKNFCVTYTYTGIPSSGFPPATRTNCFVNGVSTGSFVDQSTGGGPWDQLEVDVDNATNNITLKVCASGVCNTLVTYSAITTLAGNTGVGIYSPLGPTTSAVNGMERWDNFCAGPIGGNC